MVSNWNGFVSALNDNSIQNITISGNVVATGDNGNTDNGRVNSVDRTVAINSQGRNVVIQGRNDQASLDLLSNSLKFTGSSAWNLVFKNLQLATGNSKGAVDLSSTTGANTVTFENVKSQGSSLYGGGGNTDVIVKGETSSIATVLQTDILSMCNGMLDLLGTQYCDVKQIFTMLNLSQLLTERV